MKKTANIFSLAMAAVLILGLLAGCSGSPGQGAGTKENGAEEANGTKGSSNDKVTITYWRHDNESEVKALKQLIASFQQENPNITVKMEIIPYSDYETKIRTALAGGGAPDIMGVDGPFIASYAHQEAIVPLDEYFAEDGDFDDISKPVQQSLTYNGKVWAAPLNDASVAMFYNKKLFEEQGIPLPSQNPDEAWTWEQVLDAAKKINNPAKGVYGWDPAWGLGPGEGSAFVKMTYLWQAGADILSEDGKTAQGHLNAPEAKRALEFFNGLYNDSKVAAKELPPDAFESGKMGIMMNGPWHLPYLESHFPNFKDWAVAPLWKDKEQVTPMGSWNMAITKQSKHPKEAWKFVNWVTGKEGAKVWYKETKNLPARLSVADAFPELQEYPLNIWVKQSSTYARPRPVSPAYPAISKAITEMFDAIVLGNRNVDDALTTAVDKIDKAIANVK
ncbi:Putative ABC transporter substrate-binding protein YesO [Paenibacillus sp. CECT 9249]|uniref:ABC transporter substrate-binding protein n=1 Tax=Paenibacillus sp. CECT 9249 TaxID=2845385 RepID=UPI001E2AF100|nr:sugar ABC transporter substrate-binding protein [Paenibacillus sp. CECT 9249]CAH0120669.1 Putative ABC transporter substrate-binding protein YesO [Paenibacillus sp. CECT 9249]